MVIIICADLKEWKSYCCNVIWFVSGILQLWISITILFFAGCNNGYKTRYNQKMLFIVCS